MTIALALLLESPLADPATDLADLCRQGLATDADLSWTRHTPPDEFRETEQFRFESDGGVFLAIASDQPHPDRDAIADQVDPSARPRVAEHRGWLAVSRLPGEDEPGFLEAYGPIAAILAVACDRGGSVLHAPQWDRSTQVAPESADRLRGAQPLLGLGVVHTEVGCLLAKDSRWVSFYPSPLGPIQIDATGGPVGPAAADVERLRRILDHGLRVFRARLAFALLHRPLRVELDDQGRIRVQFRNSFTGIRSRWIAEDEVGF